MLATIVQISSLFQTSDTSISVVRERPEPITVAYSPLGGQWSLKTSTQSGIQRVQIDNLAPGTIYQYTVLDSQLIEDISYMYIPGFNDSFKILSWGDNQIGASVFRSIMNRTFSEGCVQFLGIGDYIQYEGLYSAWRNHFYDQIHPYNRFFSFIGCRGNHDGQDALAHQLWLTPGNNEWGAVTSGPIRILIVNSNIDRPQFWYTLNPGGEQHNYVDQETQSQSWRNSLYRIVVFHHPAFTEQWDGGCYYGPGNRNPTLVALMNLLEQRGASLVLNGHAHSYQRGRIGNMDWVISGGGGGYLDQRMCWDHPEVFINTGNNSQIFHYLILDVSTQRLLVESKTTSGQVFDSVAIWPRRL